MAVYVGPGEGVGEVGSFYVGVWEGGFDVVELFVAVEDLCFVLIVIVMILVVVVVAVVVVVVYFELN